MEQKMSQGHIFHIEQGSSEKAKHFLQHICKHARDYQEFEAMKDDVHEQLHKTKEMALTSVDLEKIEKQFYVLEAKLTKLLKWEQHIIEQQKDETEKTSLMRKNIIEIESRIENLERRLILDHEKNHSKQNALKELKPKFELLEQKYGLLKKKYSSNAGSKEIQEMTKIKNTISALKKEMEAAGQRD